MTVRDNVIKYIVKVEADHTSWYLNNLLHREDGPAIQHGPNTSWWIQGVCLSFMSHQSYMLMMQKQNAKQVFCDLLQQTMDDLDNGVLPDYDSIFNTRFT